jgi:hypothetical protein
LVPGHKKGADGKPDKSNPRLEVQAQILKKNGKPDKYALLYDYIAFTEASEWKLDQFLQCFGIATEKKRKGSFDTAKIVGQKFTVRVKADTYEGEYRGKLGAYIPLVEDDEADEDEDDFEDEVEDEVEEDDDFDDEDEDDEEEDEVDEEEDESAVVEAEYAMEDIEEMSLADLKAIFAENDFALPARKTKKALIAQLVETGIVEVEDEDEPF